MNSSDRPGLFIGHGGPDSLFDYIDIDVINDAESAFEANPGLKDAFWEWAYAPATYEGKIWGVPGHGTEPVVLFYNKAIFAENGLDPPDTYENMLKAIDKLAGTDVVPIVLAGQAWGFMQMYFQWLVDRIAGQEPVQKIIDGDWEGGWGDPSIRQAAEMIVDLIDRGAFGDNFASVAYGPGGTETLMTESQGAMYLMGSWAYQSMYAANPEWADSDLGWVAPPMVEGGKGDPKSVSGNPTLFFTSTNTANLEAVDEFMGQLASDEYIKDLMSQGTIPVTKNAIDFIDEAPSPEFAEFIITMIGEAPWFQQSWDMAIGTAVMTQVGAEIQRLFFKQTDVDGFIDAVLGLNPNKG
jgi:xylobiose transport system substrate-binding protein